MTTAPAIERRVWTDDELLALPGGGFWRLLDGELTKMSPAGAEHGSICTLLPGLRNQVRDIFTDPVFD